jgi:hypothetical protein
MRSMQPDVSVPRFLMRVRAKPCKSCAQPIACHPGRHLPTQRTACAARLRPLFALNTCRIIVVSIGHNVLGMNPSDLRPRTGTLRGPPEGADTTLPTCGGLDSPATRSSLSQAPECQVIPRVFVWSAAYGEHTRTIVTVTPSPNM